MRSNIITVIPVYNGEQFIAQTLMSVARQERQPDRVIVLDNCSTDRTEEIVRGFSEFKCEWIRNPSNLGLFGNCNRALEFSSETEFLNILHADDLLEPNHYEVLTGALRECEGLGMAYCLDQRIDELDRPLSVSGSITGEIEEQMRNDFLLKKAEIANHAFSGTVLKTSARKSPCQFREDMPILADMVFWADWGRHCENIFKVHLPLVKYRWHGTNTTTTAAPAIQSLILDEWRAMQMIEQMRRVNSSQLREAKLKGIFAVRSGIKARRFRQQGNRTYSRKIVRAARPVSGLPLWLAGQAVVHFRDLMIYTILRRPRHPKNVYG